MPYREHRRRGPAEALRCVVQVVYQRTCLCPGHALACVDFDPVHPVHPGEIDHHAAIAHAESGSVMASATHRQRQILVLGEFKRPRDVGRTSAANDHRRTLIECVSPHCIVRTVVISVSSSESAATFRSA